MNSKDQATIPSSVNEHPSIGPLETDSFIHEDRKVASPARKLPVAALRGIVPAIPERIVTDFEDQIEEAMEEEADRIVADMEGH